MGDGEKQLGDDKIVLAQSCSSLTNIRKLFGVELICFVNAGLGYLNQSSYWECRFCSTRIPFGEGLEP